MMSTRHFFETCDCTDCGSQTVDVIDWHVLTCNDFEPVQDCVILEDEIPDWRARGKRRMGRQK